MECCTDQEWKGTWDPFVRLCFQFGMLLGVDEFQQDLGFHLCKHRLNNRLFNGWGLVWSQPPGGVRLDYDPDPAEEKVDLFVGPLFALDELGRELWVKDECKIDLFRWASENALGDDVPIYVTISYRACCVAPVPAVAAPCDDSAAPTMPSRVLESVQAHLSLDPPEHTPPAPIDLSDAAPTADDTQAIRFRTLVDLIRNDAERPILLGTVARRPPAGGDVHWVFTPNPQLPRITAVGGEALRVLESSVIADRLRVTFSRRPDWMPAAGFRVYQYPTPPAAPTQLVAGAATVDADPDDPTNPNKISILLTPAPAAGSNMRIEIAGGGPDALVVLTTAGPIPLNDGRNHVRWTISTP
jgi:hypothetical protein